jgi:hypothetical protein
MPSRLIRQLGLSPLRVHHARASAGIVPRASQRDGATDHPGA